MPVQPARRRPTVVTGALLVLILASCARANASPEPTVAPSPASVTNVAARPTSPTTGASSTVVVPSTTPSTTAALTLQEQVAADFLATVDAYFRCGADPTACDLTSFAVAGSPVYKSFATWMELFAREGIRLRPGPDHQFVIETIVILPGDSRAIVSACRWDTSTIYDPNGTTDPADDIIIDDHRVATRAVHEMERTADGWRQATLDIYDKRVGENLCDA